MGYFCRSHDIDLESRLHHTPIAHARVKFPGQSLRDFSVRTLDLLVPIPGQAV